MNEECINLNYTFDTRFIKENKDLFYKISKENINTGKGNNTLMRLIINEKDFKDDRAKMCEFIKGPNSLSKHYNEEKNITIYLFGEHHLEEDSCNELSNNFLGIDDFLEQLMTKTNVFLDIYLEVGTDDLFYNKLPKKSKLYLLYNKLNPCINSKTRDNLEKCSLSRIHYGDIRDVTFMGKIRNSYYNMNLSINDILKYENGYVLNVVDSFSKCKSKAEISAFLEKDFTFNIRHRVFQKEISKSPYGKEIVAFFRSIIVNENLERYYKLYNRIVEISTNLMVDLKTLKANNYKPNSTFYIKVMKEMLDFLNLYISNLYYMMDIYLLCRIFKESKYSKNKPSLQHNIIIYSGENHSYNYRKFLDSINFKMEKYTDNLKPFKNCVNVKDFLPLFG